MSAHETCTHPKTKSARAACRRAAAKGVQLAAPVVAPLATAIQTPIAETPAVIAAAEGLREISLSGQIDAYQLSATLEKVAKINERAARKGLAGTLSVEWEPVECSETNELTKITETWTEYKISIQGNAPAFNGWEFIAKLDWDANAGLIVRAMPGAIQADRESLREGWCDHCKTTRRRSVTYVVRNQETGVQLQVGSSCLKDFTGQFTTISFPALPEEDSERDGWFGASSPREFSPLTVMSVAWACIKLNGFKPARSEGSTTRNDVMTALYPSKSKHDREFAEMIAPLADEATEAAAKILAFILSDEFDGTTDYVLNLKSIAAGKAVSTRNVGMIASAPQAYAKHLDRTLIREREASIYAASEHVGNIKERMEMGVVVKNVRYIEGEYGTTTLYTMVDTAGNVIKWFASSDKLGDQPGATAVIKATIKSHEEYQGHKITHITRAAIIEFTDAPEMI